MMDIFEIGKGCLFLIAAFLYFKFFNKPLKGGTIIEKTIDFKALVGAILLIICGLIILYNQLAINFEWIQIVNKSK